MRHRVAATAIGSKFRQATRLIQKANLKEEAECSDKVAPTWNSAMRQFAKRGKSVDTASTGVCQGITEMRESSGKQC